jgi:flagellar biosynthesis/type III secretory pathway chaperone
MSETQEKVAILKRLRDMLVRQRGRFQAYLDVLEQEASSISRGDAESLLVQVEMEQTIIAEIFALKKVIAPLEVLYKAAYPGTEDSVPRLKAVLDSMGSEIAAHNSRNRQLLKDRMEDLRTEIRSLRTWPKTAYASPSDPRLIDITT